MKTFRTYQLAVTFYRECESLRLPTHLKDQLSRASSSISLNLAEGYSKPTRKDQLKFYFIAFGSLRECQAILELASVTIVTDAAAKTADALGGSLYRLTKS